jgi:hypothetical protein
MSIPDVAERLKANAAKTPNVRANFQLPCTNPDGFMLALGWGFRDCRMRGHGQYVYNRKRYRVMRNERQRHPRSDNVTPDEDWRCPRIPTLRRGDAVATAPAARELRWPHDRRRWSRGPCSHAGRLDKYAAPS